MYDLFDATLGGVRFSSISEEVFLTDIVEEEAQMDTKTDALALRDGLIRTLNRRRALSVRLVCVIRTEDVAMRATLRDKVTAWAARGGILKVNTRPGKRLCVVMDKPPALQSSMRWTDTVTITLTAYGMPYWEDASAHTLAITTTDADGANKYTGELSCRGSAPDAPVSAILRNMGDNPLTDITITVGDTHMHLTGLQVAAGTGEIVIEYTEGHLLAIYDSSNGTNLMPNRTPQSDDDLLAKSNVRNSVIITADQPVEGAVAVRGRWL